MIKWFVGKCNKSKETKPNQTKQYCLLITTNSIANFTVWSLKFIFFLPGKKMKLKLKQVRKWHWRFWVTDQNNSLRKCTHQTNTGTKANVFCEFSRRICKTYGIQIISGSHVMPVWFKVYRSFVVIPGLGRGSRGWQPFWKLFWNIF